MLIGCSRQPDSQGVFTDEEVGLKPNLEERVANIEHFLKKPSDNWVTINPDEPTYQVIETPSGKLFIRTEDVKPFLDGYKISLKICNPNSVTFNSAKLICVNYGKSISEIRLFTNNIEADLVEGRWTGFNFILAPATPEEVRRSSVTITVNGISVPE